MISFQWQQLLAFLVLCLLETDFAICPHSAKFGPGFCRAEQIWGCGGKVAPQGACGVLGASQAVSPRAFTQRILCSWEPLPASHFWSSPPGWGECEPQTLRVVTAATPLPLPSIWVSPASSSQGWAVGFRVISPQSALLSFFPSCSNPKSGAAKPLCPFQAQICSRLSIPPSPTETMKLPPLHPMRTTVCCFLSPEKCQQPLSNQGPLLPPQENNGDISTLPKTIGAAGSQGLATSCLYHPRGMHPLPSTSLAVFGVQVHHC